MTQSKTRKSAQSNDKADSGTTAPATATEPGTTTPDDAPATGPDSTETPTPDGNSGPGTGVEARPEQAARPPATMLDTGSTESGPLDPPGDAREQAKPEKGHNESSTDHVYAASGGRTIAGEDHLRLEDEDGNELSADSLFEDDPNKTWVTSKTRVYEVFRYPNTTVDAKRLLFAEGRRVPRVQAERIKAELDSAPAPASGV